ncbi:hypothetical protein ACFL4Y_04080, partial [Gemmatimonadota bacterium]
MRHSDRAGRSRRSLAAAAVLLLAWWTATGIAVTAQPMEGEEQITQISSIDLIQGVGPGFRLVIRAEQARDHVVFWIRDGHTVVVDMRHAYTPFRGRAVGEIPAPSVVEVRASQFLDRELPIARFELDLTSFFSASSRWIGSDLEVTFLPGQPGFTGTGSTREPAGVPGAEPPGGGAVTEPPGGGPPGAVVGAGESRSNPFDPLLKPPEGIDPTN